MGTIALEAAKCEVKVEKWTEEKEQIA